MSDDAKDLISRLLQVDSSKRMKPDEALNHSWIVGTRARKITLNHDLKKNINKLVFKKNDNSQ